MNADRNPNLRKRELKTVYKIKKRLTILLSVFEWLGRESNPRHKDFQSFALPTELPSLMSLSLFRFGDAKVRLFF